MSKRPRKRGSPLRKDADRAHRRKHDVLSHPLPSHVSGIAEAITLKNQDLFLVCERDGFVPIAEGHGLGLYYHDCRYMSAYACDLDGSGPEPLVAISRQGFQAIFQLTRSETSVAEADDVPREAVEVRLERSLTGSPPTMEDRFHLRNYGNEPTCISLKLTFQSAFEDIFAVRGLWPPPGREPVVPHWQDGVLLWRHRGEDGLTRELRVRFSLAPLSVEQGAARFQVELGAQGTECLAVSFSLNESGPSTPAPPSGIIIAAERCHLLGRADAEGWPADFMHLHSSNAQLDETIAQGLRDMRTLKSTLRGYAYLMAGIPWFGTLFGRDSLISAYQMLAYDPTIAGQTLQLLASYQGRTFDEWRDEEPGQILHELRVGELAHTGAIPHSPYYGAIDATPLFLIVMERYCAWTGDVALFRTLRDNVERALAWIDRRLEATGYLIYDSLVGRSLVNQGWKDSGNAIVNADGSLGRPPIAMVEVQGYVIRAWEAMASLFEQIGEPEPARALKAKAAALGARLNQDFWVADLGCYAMALQTEAVPVAVISSNPGHLLWAGAAATDRAQQLVDRLMTGDMFSGWGIRTLSNREWRFNPVSYHLGTVWPHDNALIAAGFRRYGHHAEAERLFQGLCDAAAYFDHFRMPELFSGFSRASYSEPVHFPVACHPQAWAAGALPFLLVELLGLDPDAANHRLTIRDARLPGSIDRLELHGLRVANSRINLGFERHGTKTAITVLAKEGPVDIVVD